MGGDDGYSGYSAAVVGGGGEVGRVEGVVGTLGYRDNYTAVRTSAIQSPKEVLSNTRCEET